MKCHVEKKRMPESNPIPFYEPLYLLLNASWRACKVKICDDMFNLIEAHRNYCSNNHFTIIKKENADESDHENDTNIDDETLDILEN